MTDYSFTCPLTGCGVVMTTHAEDVDTARADLVGQAKQHLARVHPEIKKSDQEVNEDIGAHMVKAQV